MPFNHCPIHGEKHVARKAMSYPWQVFDENNNYIGTYSEAICDCGASIYYDGFPFRRQSPYIGNYFRTGSDIEYINDAKQIKVKRSNIHYESSDYLPDWYFPGQ